MIAIMNIDWVSMFTQFGVGGGVLLWFMFKSEPRLRAIEAAIDRMAKAMLLLAVEISHNDVVKEQAEGLKKEIEEAEALRGRK